ncbi:MAG: hypothetical protein K6F76_02800 [Clostridiales bacterium]|nr:hypothetical protein [Clostridiales bacterium]
MKKIGIVMLCGIILILSSCGNLSVTGTWSFEKILYNGTEYNTEELKTLNESIFVPEVVSMIDAVIIIKEGTKPDCGNAFICSNGQIAAVEWSLSNNSIKIGELTCSIDKDYIIACPTESSKLFFKRASNSQDISQFNNNNDSAIGASESNDSITESETNSTGIINSNVINTTDDCNYDRIISDGESAIQTGISELKSEWDKLSGTIDSYDTYVKNFEKVEDYYSTIYSKTEIMCSTVYATALDYAKSIQNSSLSGTDKYKQCKNIERDIYDDLCDIIEKEIYDQLFDDIEDHFYNGVLDDSNDVNVDYSDWYDTKYDEYDLWYNTKSDVYEEWYNTKSDIYSFYYDLSSEYYSGDFEQAQTIIDKFEKKLSKR